MNRYLIVGTLSAALAIFAWQTLSNTLLGWHEATLSQFAEPGMAIDAMDVVAPENGMYFHEAGIVAAVSRVPGVDDKSTLMGGMLLRQLALNLIAVFLLALVVARLALTPLRAALLLGAVALAAGTILELSNWNWYGFPLDYVLVNLLDTAINVALASAILGWFAHRWLHAATDGLAPPAATPAT